MKWAGPIVRTEGGICIRVFVYKPEKKIGKLGL